MGPYSPEYMDEMERQEEVRRRLKEKMSANPALNPNLPKNFISKKDKDDAAQTQNIPETQGVNTGPSSKMQNDDMAPLASQGIDPRMRLRQMLLARAGGQGLDDSQYLQQMNQARENNALNQLMGVMAQTTSKMGTLGGKRADVTNFQPLTESLYNRDVGGIQDAKAMQEMRGLSPREIKEMELGLKADENAQRMGLEGDKRAIAQENLRMNQERLNLMLRQQEERERANRASEALGEAKADRPKEEKPPTSTEAEAKMRADVTMKALPAVEAMENEGYRPGPNVLLADTLGKGAGNYALSAQDQLYRTNIDVIVDQILRADTGAAATADEIRRTLSKYAVQPGDKEGTIKTKQKLRRDYIDSLLGKAGPAAKGVSLPPMAQPQAAPMQKPKFLYSQSRNKTKIVYPDGREKIVDGYVTEDVNDGGR